MTKKYSELVENAAVNGSRTLNPYNFRHFGLTQLALHITPSQYGCLIESIQRMQTVYPSVSQIFTKNLVKTALQNPD